MKHVQYNSMGNVSIIESREEGKSSGTKKVLTKWDVTMGRESIDVDFVSSGDLKFI